MYTCRCVTIASSHQGEYCVLQQILCVLNNCNNLILLKLFYSVSLLREWIWWLSNVISVNVKQYRQPPINLPVSIVTKYFSCIWLVSWAIVCSENFRRHWTSLVVMWMLENFSKSTENSETFCSGCLSLFSMLFFDFG